MNSFETMGQSGRPRQPDPIRYGDVVTLSLAQARALLAEGERLLDQAGAWGSWTDRSRA
jgi:hypothetical protein